MKYLNKAGRSGTEAIERQARWSRCYFALATEQRKLLALLDTLGRIGSVNFELLEHGQDLYAQAIEQHAAIASAQVVFPDVVSGESGLRLSACTEMLDKIAQRTASEEMREQFLTNRIKRVESKIGFQESIVKQTLLRIQPLVEEEKISQSAEADIINSLYIELQTLSSFPAVFIENFDSTAYLSAYPDLVPALTGGQFASPVIHFIKHGFDEIRSGQRRLRGDNPIHQLVLGSSTTTNDNDAGLEGKGGLQDLSKRSEGGSETESLSDFAREQRQFLETLRDTGLVDHHWYRATHGDCDDPDLHYLTKGLVNGLAPNFLFDSDWYYSRYLIDQQGLTEDSKLIDMYDECNLTKDDKRNVLATEHYVKYGIKLDLAPGPGFDVEWYRRNYFDPKLAANPLSHYLTVGTESGYAPNREFDVEYYCRSNPDVVREGLEPVRHFYSKGWKENRKPNAQFQIELYRNWHMNGETSLNPLDHYCEFGRNHEFPVNEAGMREFQLLHRKKQTLPSNIKYRANPGDSFEHPLLRAGNSTSDISCIAFYLPQFHEFDENNEWWGNGFTEWRNVARGTPRFKGHYQPRVPRDLGYYSLETEATLQRQAELAVANGIEAFCFYYYWFNGKRLMDKPLDQFAESDSIDMPFCIMWANENWTRTWDGHDSEVLIRQDYNKTDDQSFIEDTARYFDNPRYIRVGDRPLFIIYRPGIIPNARETIARWREAWEQRCGQAPLIFMVQGFGDTDPDVFGLDGALEFPPHKIAAGLQDIQSKLEILDSDFAGSVFSYADAINSSLTEEPAQFPLVKTVSPHWDNDARREGRGLVLHGSSPELFQQWLNGACRYAESYPVEGKSMVFINAWNEWAESAYLEPDVHYGFAYLNSVKRVMQQIPDHRSTHKILLVGHDAHPHGAQMLLLNIGRVLTRQLNVAVEYLLLNGGSLLSQYESVAPVHLADELSDKEISRLVDGLGCRMAITNTAVTGRIVPLLKQSDIQVVSLVHELPRIAREHGLIESGRFIAQQSDIVICASEFVMQGFESYAGQVRKERVVRPQGNYKSIELDAEAGLAIREKLGIPAEHKIVMNAGFADLRKGVDKFISIAEQTIRRHDDIHFIWVGEVASNLSHWLLDVQDTSAEQLHFVGYSDDMSDYYNAANCFLLTSREDPYPTVVLEAMSVGCAPVIFKGCTGLEELVSDHGRVVDAADMDEITAALSGCLFNDKPEDAAARIEVIREEYAFDLYCFELLQALDPALKRISVVVPNYNYAHHLQQRLSSVLNQTYPVFEVIILDDASSDDSLEVIDRLIKNSGRLCRRENNTVQSGSVFRQWAKGIEMARGDYVWIAEADDDASPDFLSGLADRMSPESAIAFSNSSQIDQNSAQLADDYNYYYQEFPVLQDCRAFSMEGAAFVEKCMSVKNPILNVSSVIWKKSNLAKALECSMDDVTAYRLVGDWHLYLEVLSQPETEVCYVPEALNVHRRHSDSVTHSIDPHKHLGEIDAIHSLIKVRFGVSSEIESDMADYLGELRQQFGISEAESVRSTAPSDDSDSRAA